MQHLAAEDASDTRGAYPSPGGRSIVASADTPAGRFFIRFFAGMPVDGAKAAYNIIWGVHAALALIFIAYIPYSRIFHVFAAQITTFAARKRERESNIV